MVRTTTTMTTTTCCACFGARLASFVWLPWRQSYRRCCCCCCCCRLFHSVGHPLPIDPNDPGRGVSTRRSDNGDGDDDNDNVSLSLSSLTRQTVDPRRKRHDSRIRSTGGRTTTTTTTCSVSLVGGRTMARVVGPESMRLRLRLLSFLETN